MYQAPISITYLKWNFFGLKIISSNYQIVVYHFDYTKPATWILSTSTLISSPIYIGKQGYFRGWIKELKVFDINIFNDIRFTGN